MDDRKAIRYPAWTEELAKGGNKARQDYLELCNDEQQAKIRRGIYRYIELNDNMVIYARKNKERRSLKELASKIRCTTREMYDACCGITFKHLNEDYPPWPTIEEMRRDPQAWEKRRLKCVEIKRKKKEAKNAPQAEEPNKVHPWRVKANTLKTKGIKAWNLK